MTTGLSAVLDAFAVLYRAAEQRTLVGGLMGEASIRTITSSGLGSGVGTRASESDIALESIAPAGPF